MLHHGPRRENRIARTADAGDGAGRAIAPIHDGGVHLLLAGGGIDRAASGIEERLVLERHHGGGHRIERAAAIGENDASRFQGAAQAGMIGSLPLGRHLAAQDRAGAAMDGESEIAAG